MALPYDERTRLQMMAAGNVDLTNCDREPIHIPGHIQPHGAMLVADPARFEIRYASANIEAITGYAGEIAAGMSLDDIVGRGAAHAIRNAAAKCNAEGVAGIELGVELAYMAGRVDIIAHRYKDRLFIEIEPSTDDGNSAKNALDLTQALIRRIGVETNVESLATSGARLVQAMLGYDRVMVYQFLHNGAGKVIAETKRHDLHSFMGQHFPAGDIPYQARRLYKINAIRMIGDVAYVPVPLQPVLQAGEQPVDMSFAQLRSVSPIHCEYLQNMGVRASLSISIMVDGELWGLISCHHDSAHVVPIPLRIGADLFGQYFSLQVAVAERRSHIIASGLAREGLDRILSKLTLDEKLVQGLRENLKEFSALFDCQGVGIWSENEWASFGVAPTEEEGLALVRYLSGEATPNPDRSESAKLGLWYTQDLRQETKLPFFGEAVAGALAIPLTSTPRDYLIFFRSEEAHEIEWAGEPTKQTVSTPQGERLTPRGSFMTWREDVRGQSRPWSESDLVIGEAMRTYLRDVFLKQNEATADERRRLDHRRRILNDELNHRVKNIITLVKSIATQTGAHAETVAEYSASLEGRLRALAFAHDQSLSSTVGGDLGTLIEAEAGLHRHGADQERVIAAGSQVRLNDRAFGVLALVIHELMTNAAKYGALSAAEGILEISWLLNDKGDCEITWVESRGPPVSTPNRQGFGSQLIQTTIVYDLGGKAKIEYNPDGLRAYLSIPGKHVTVNDEGAVASYPVAAESNSTSLADMSILLVEDQSLIALDTEEILRNVGARDVRLSPDATHAILTLGSFKPNAVILDFNLGDGTSEKVADHLRAMGIPFIFATGYGDSVMIPERFRSVPVVRKPASAGNLVMQLSAAMQASEG